MGGLGIRIPTEVTNQEFDNSLTLTKPLVESIHGDKNLNSQEIKEAQHKARLAFHQKNKEADIAKAEEIMKSIPKLTKEQSP